MADALSWRLDNGTLYLAGMLDGESVLALWQQRESLGAAVHTFELSGLSRVDTAGLALIIHLVAQVKKQGGMPALRGGSDNLQTLAQLYNLPESLLPGITG